MRERGWFHYTVSGWHPDPDRLEKLIDGFTESVWQSGGEVESGGGALSMTKRQYDREQVRLYHGIIRRAILKARRFRHTPNRFAAQESD